MLKHDARLAGWALGWALGTVGGLALLILLIELAAARPHWEPFELPPGCALAVTDTGRPFAVCPPIPSDTGDPAIRPRPL